MFERTKSLLERNEKRLSVLAFVGGFVWDSITLTRVDRLYDNLVLGSYLVIVFAAIVLLNGHGAGKFQGAIGRQGIRFARILLPFCFGGLFSGLLIFYLRSGEFLSSAPFLLILAGFLFGNELFRRHYQRFIFQMCVFLVTLVCYIALILPVISGRIGGLMFVLSTVIAVLIFFVALRAIRVVAKEEVERSRFALWSMVAIVLIAFNSLYFNNMIPPVPLSLEAIGLYHTITRERSGEYEGTYEPAPWYAFGQRTSSVYHRRGNEPIYAFSSVFAPTRLDTEVLHRWSYYDESTRAWVSSSVIGFPIFGGRDGGYRGYSIKENLAPGKWRVDVETLRGQIIGRLVFRVENDTPPQLAESMLQ